MFLFVRALQHIYYIVNKNKRKKNMSSHKQCAIIFRSKFDSRFVFFLFSCAQKLRKKEKKNIHSHKQTFTQNTHTHTYTSHVHTN